MPSEPRTRPASGAVQLRIERPSPRCFDFTVHLRRRCSERVLPATSSLLVAMPFRASIPDSPGIKGPGHTVEAARARIRVANTMQRSDLACRAVASVNEPSSTARTRRKLRRATPKSSGQRALPRRDRGVSGRPIAGLMALPNLAERGDVSIAKTVAQGRFGSYDKREWPGQ